MPTGTPRNEVREFELEWKNEILSFFFLILVLCHFLIFTVAIFTNFTRILN